MATTRIYVVKSASDVRLVEAMNGAQAVRHATRQAYTVSVATQAELVALVGAGAIVEQAKEAPATEEA